MESESGQLVVVTPSYARDYQLCRDLNRSIVAWMPEHVQHHIVVPRKDLPLFRALASSRTVIHDVGEFLPSDMLKMPAVNLWVNIKRPWPPIRGWITQQLVKLSTAATLDADAVLLIDSDMVLVAPTELASFQQDGKLAMYRKPEAVHEGLPRHRLWLESARSLLGLEPPDAGNLTDYICWPCIWDAETVRAMLGRIEEVTGMAWQSAIAAQLHFSEMMLYGTYVDEVLGGPPAATSDMKSISYSDEVALSSAELSGLLRAGPTDVLAVMISAKAGIPEDVRSNALDDYAEYLAESHSGFDGGAP
ncbi:DUF6492 family protein [Arthrobacter sp. TE12232]